MEEKSIQTPGQGLCVLPLDVLCILVRGLELKDRLRLEVVDTNHRNVFREPQLWQEVNLAAMQAVSLTEEQLFNLLIRSTPCLQKVELQIRRMTKIIHRLSEATPDKIVPEVIRFQVGEDLLYLFLRALRNAHRLFNPGSRARFAVESCTIWFCEQVECIPDLCLTAWMSIKEGLKELQEVKPVLNRLANFLKTPSGKSPKADFLLDVSKAERLSPAFLAALTVALSAAGYKVTLKMEGLNDPAFPLTPLLSILQGLAPDCSIQVRSSVFADFDRHWPNRIRKQFLSQGPQGGQPQGAMDALIEGVADVQALPFASSEASYGRFVGKVTSLVKLKSEMESAASKTRSGGAKAKLTVCSLIIKNFVSIDEEILKELLTLLQEYPPGVPLELQDCKLEWGNLEGLCHLLGKNPISFLSFRKLHKQDIFSDTAVLSSGGLASSKCLQRLELDLPLSLSWRTNNNLKELAWFLKTSGEEVEVVVHLRPAFYVDNVDELQQILLMLKELTELEGGARLRVVQHCAEKTAGNATDKGKEGLCEDSLLAVVRKENALKARRKEFRIMLPYMIQCVVYLCLLLLLAYLLYLTLWIGLELPEPDSFFFVRLMRPSIVFLWGPLQSMILGEPDWVGMVFALWAMGFVPSILLQYTFLAFCCYIGACIVRSIAGHLVKNSNSPLWTRMGK